LYADLKTGLRSSIYSAIQLPADFQICTILCMLEQLIAQGESTTLEFKRTIEHAARIAKTLVAFANTKGGTLLVGVSDSGNITGISSELQEMQKIEQAARFICEPPVELSYQTVHVCSREVLVISIEESEQKPHFVKEAPGKQTAYVRAKDKSVPAGKGMLHLLHMEDTLQNTQLLHERHVKTLLTFLRTHEYVTAKKYAKLINISEGRAGKILKDLSLSGILLLHDRQKPVMYSLK
jgi:predicted HTH transcriptional regulator